ncbi:hypothetical protein TRAPUB_13571 [Trametes pubescens]|uniref:Uncharacterized protein n=1 Tax=Trametes pubescens TaxID=154538 RepID=A0A1M2VQP7_TRAPU|nr:hypothetical protein TRAPUB_13571 [Trametes pubescens]
MVFTEYKWANPFRDFMENEFRTLFPSNGNGTARNPAPTTPPNAPNALSPPPTHHSGKPKAITPSEVSGYLNDPRTLLGKQFLHAPPPDVEQDFKGSWEAESYSVRMREGHIDHEFLIRLEAFGAPPLPMGKDDVEFLLGHSTLV